MEEKSGVWLIEIVMHIICLVICIGILIGCSVTLSTIQDISYFEDDIVDEYSDYDNDRARFRAVAGWLLFGSIAGIASRVLLMTCRGLCYAQICKRKYLAFAAASNFYTLLLALSLTAGGSSIAGNAIDVQQDYIEEISCPGNDERESNLALVNMTECDSLEMLRDAQAGAGALAFVATGVCIVTNVVVLIGLIKPKYTTDV